jgi:hypothetical protein
VASSVLIASVVAVHPWDRLPSGFVRPRRSRWTSGIFDGRCARHGAVTVAVRRFKVLMCHFVRLCVRSPSYGKFGDRCVSYI